MTVSAFWNGGNQWIVRFAPIMSGEWVWQSRCSNKKDSGLHDVSGKIVCMEPDATERENNPNNRGFLRVHENGRYFEYAYGTPFYWPGDTLWFIYADRCTMEAVLPRYIDDRKRKGFTVIQIAAGRPGGGEFEWNGVNDRPHWFSNEAGEPFMERYTLINPRYFQLLDAKIDLLHRAGLVLCIMGFWGFDIKIGLQAGDVRFAAYVSLLQGCIGQTYGAHGIWNLYEQSDHLLWDDFHRPDCWDHDLDLPGSMLMKYLKDAF